MKTSDGGPAFPCDWKDFQPETGNQVVREQFPGMSLRDWFAGMSMLGMTANPDISRAMSDESMKPKEVRRSFAARAYAQADEMLAERNK